MVVCDDEVMRAELDESPPKLEKSEIKTTTVHVYVKCPLLSSCYGHSIGGVLVQNRFIPDFGGTRRVCLDKARNVLENKLLSIIDCHTCRSLADFIIEHHFSAIAQNSSDKYLVSECDRINQLTISQTK